MSSELKLYPGPINVKSWIKENESSFCPPVCNKLMYGDGQLKVMFVGSPNERRDYHIEEGEELFFQYSGDICLPIFEKNSPKPVDIREGEMFILPGKMPHSPQRPNIGSIGLVLERERLAEEKDCLRYYTMDKSQILWEEWFYCSDLGTQLPPVIKKFKESEEAKTDIPSPNILKPENAPFLLDSTTSVDSPFVLQKWIDENLSTIQRSGDDGVLVYGKGETKVYIFGGNSGSTQNERGHSEAEVC
eukprot:TRINITY_DN3947_c0_g2_i1.p1 TRINITY_DN3947_c0_g2~~TRINITY_DN3947_c0_g2_i1.p1  ORF type:complete len:246 (+),score=53.58 TRINITY_DN3947_c0_g2_i1:56-793(+)